MLNRLWRRFVAWLIWYLEPYPKIYDHPAGAGLFGFALILLLLAFRKQKGLSLLPDTPVVAVGDPMFGFYMIAGSIALNDFQPSKLRFYHKWWWYVAIGSLITLVNLANEYNNVRLGFPLTREFEPSQLAHHFLVPLYALHVAGALFSIIMSVKGHWVAKTFALGALTVYVVSFFITLSKGESMIKL